jgi:hypothetical protein
VTVRFEARQDPDIDYVWAWFEYQIALLAESQASVLRRVGSGAGTAGQAPRPHEEQFLGLTRGEVEEFFSAQRDQLELVTMMEILATVEGALRIDFETRVAAKKKDALSRRFRDLRKSRGEKIRLDEDILTSINEEGGHSQAISDFRGALNLRHWLAHGRHWHPKLGRPYGPNDVYDIGRALIAAIPA